MQKHLLALTLAGSVPFAALAETPDVETDIRPVAGLVAAVLGTSDTINAIIPPGASPHDYSIKPSTARRISGADAVFWVGPELSPWLSDVLNTLAPDTSVQLHDAGDDHEDGHEEGHDDEHKDDHGDDHAGEHGDEHDDEHGDNHGDEHADKHDDDHDKDAESAHHDHHHGEDPHVWLDPATAMAWIDIIAETMPDHAQDATAIKTTIKLTADQLQTRLNAIKSRPYIVYHDGYAGFEEHFGLSHLAAITDGHAAKPGAAKRAELNTLIEQHNPTCLFIDTPNPSALATQIAAEHNLKIRTLDMMGNDIALNARFYPNLLTNLTDVITDCLGE